MENIFRHTRSLLVVATITVVLFFALFYTFSHISDVVFDKMAQRQVQDIQSIFESEGKNLLSHAQEVAILEDVRRFIDTEDVENIAPILAQEMEKRDINILQAVDKDGIVIYRAHAPDRRGDDVFSTTPWGRRTRDGEEVVTFGEGRTQPFILIATHPIMENGELKGAIFAGYSFEDEFTREFKEKYLPDNTEIAFYGAVNGIAGSSFEGDEEKKLINAYMNIGSDFLQGRKQKDKILLGATYFNLYNVELNGFDEQMGGGLVFVRINNASRSIILAFFTALSFAGLFYFIEIRRKKEKFLKQHFLGSVLIFIAVFVLAFLSSQYNLYRQSLKIGSTPFTIYNSTLSLSPSYDIYEAGKQQRITIEIETGGERINVVGAYVKFNPKMVRVDEIITTNSFCAQNLFIEKSIDNAGGEVRISCGLPTPGLPKSTKSSVADLLITPLAEGYFSLSFSTETTVLANDGLGTDVLRFAENAGYQTIISRQALSGGTPPSVPVFSNTHPNREIKYNTSKVSFSWAIFPGYGYVYEFDQNPVTIPDSQNFTNDNNLSFTALSDGTHYLHIAATKDGITGPVTHYPVNIDTTPPAPPQILASSRSIRSGDVVRFEFKVDENDDLQPNVYLKIDGGTFVPTTPQVYVPFFDAGTHRVTVRVFDNASNFSDSAVDIYVRGTRMWGRFFYFDIGSWFR